MSEMLTVLTIVLSVTGVVLWALCVQRGARRRLALTPEHPDKAYDTSGPYMCDWLNNTNDHRSLAMAFFDWAARVEADRAKREAQRQADLHSRPGR